MNWDKKYFVLTVVVLAIMSLTSCTDSNKALTTGGDPKPNIVQTCTIPGNEETELCIQECEKNPAYSWCSQAPLPASSCPTDSFIAIDPYSGEEISFPEAGAISGVSSEMIMSVSPFEDSKLDGLLISRGPTLYIEPEDTDINIVNIGVAKPILSVDDFKKAYYEHLAILGTNSDLTVIPYSLKTGSPAILSDSIKTFDKLGGIKQVISAASINLTTPKNSTTGGVYSSINVPLTGQAATTSGGSNNFIYMLTLAGDIWRVTVSAVESGGGCVERIYASKKHLDTHGHKLIAKKMAVAGQYIAFITRTANDKLPILSENLQALWENIQQAIPTNKLIVEDFYWLANHMEKQAYSEQSLKLINLWDSEDGKTSEISTIGTKKVGETDIPYQEIATDLYLKGSKLVIGGFWYHKDNKPNFEQLAAMWNSAKKRETLDGDMEIIVGHSGSGYSLVDLIKPETSLEFNFVKPAGQAIARPIFSTVTQSTKEDYIYVRSEDQRISQFEIGKDDNIPPVDLKEVGSELTPYASVFDESTKSVITTFIDNLEKIKLGTNFKINEDDPVEIVNDVW